MAESKAGGLFKDTGPVEGRKLVLGFDGECFSCSDLARRVRGTVGDTLTVRSLGDPQVRRWREETLGEDAPWAPTLFEVGAGRIRAWTGVRMGLALSRALGPTATWRVMQALGEVGAAPKTEASRLGPISRGRFLKGVGGAAVAMSVLSGGALFPSAASAEVTSGTAEQRTLAKQIVRRTRQYQSLADLQANLGVAFDFPKAEIRVLNDRRASVVVWAYHDRRTVLAGSLVHLIQETLMYYDTLVFAPVNSRELRLTHFVNGHLPSRDHKTLAGDGYIITEDNRMMSPERFKQELEQADSVQTRAIAAPDCPSYETYF